MASGDAWNAGWNIGAQLAQERRAQKQGRANELWEDKRNELHSNIANLTAKYSTLLGPSGEETPESLKVKYALNQAELAKDEFQNPPKTPGAMARFEQLLHLTRRPQAPAVTTETGGVEMPATAPDASAVATPPPLAAPGAPGDESSVASGPASLRAQAQQLQQNAQAPEPAMPASATAGLEAGAGPKTPGQTYTVKGPALTPKQWKERLQANRRAQQESGQLLAAAALSPAQQAELQARTSMASTLATLEETLNAVDKFFTPEQRERARQAVLDRTFGGVAADMGKWDQVPGKVDGQPTTLLYNEKTGLYKTRTGDPVPTEVLNKFVADPKVPVKSPTSKFGMNVESYKELHGLPIDLPLAPEQLNFVEQQIALSSAAPSTNVTNTLKQDFRGFWVPIQERNRRIPGFGVILKDPLGSIPDAPGAARSSAEVSPAAGTTTTAGGAQTPPSVVPKTPAEARKQAQTRPGGTVAPKASATGAVRVGQELFAAPNKEYSDAKTAYDGAVLRAKTMDKNLVGVLNNDQQAMLSMVANHIGMTLSAQRGARINQAVWNEAIDTAPWLARQIASWFHQDANGDYIFDGFKTGVKLTADQARQMDNLAHEKVEIQKQDLDRLTQQLSTPQGAAASEPTGEKSLADRLNDALGGK